ncbi:hypothetical protein [Thermomonospora amylolytica]
MVTLITGERAPEDLSDLLEGHLRETRPDVELVAYEGGQVLYPLLIGVE